MTDATITDPTSQERSSTKDKHIFAWADAIDNITPFTKLEPQPGITARHMSIKVLSPRERRAELVGSRAMPYTTGLDVTVRVL